MKAPAKDGVDNRQGALLHFHEGRRGGRNFGPGCKEVERLNRNKGKNQGETGAC